MRACKPEEEMTWCVVTQETVRGKTTSTVEWCETKAHADTLAQDAVDSAKADSFAIQVFVCHAKKQATVDDAGNES